MSAVIAIYENGVFRPTEPVQLPEKCEVRIEYHIPVEGAIQSPACDADELSIEDELARIGAEVPPEEWARVPADLTDQLDHYVYGTPKV